MCQKTEPSAGESQRKRARPSCPASLAEPRQNLSRAALQLPRARSPPGSKVQTASMRHNRLPQSAQPQPLPPKPSCFHRPRIFAALDPIAKGKRRRRGSSLLDWEPLALAAPFSTGFSASGIAGEGFPSVEMLGFAFRAGAAALAEPADVATENPELDGAVASVLLNVISGAASAAACGAIFAETVCVFDVVINGESICFGTAFAESVDSAKSR